MTTPALSLDHVTCTFAARGDRGTYTAIRDVSLTVADGEFVSLVGPTGCGKSTLLNVGGRAAAARRSGSVSVFGKPLAGVNREAGYLFQADALLPWRNALDNVAAGLEFRGVPQDEARARAAEWLERVGLGQHMRQVSAPAVRRHAQARGLAQTWILGPRILLMDEPFSALDVQTRQLMENELLELWSQTASRCCS